MHGLMHPNYCQITILLVAHLCSSLAYFMMTQPLPVAGKLPIKTLVAIEATTNNYAHGIQLLHKFKNTHEISGSMAKNTHGTSGTCKHASL